MCWKCHFGEFFEEEPEDFIQSINQAYDVIQDVSPGIENDGEVARWR